MTSNIIIRHGKASDLERLTEIYNHYILNSTATFDVSPFTPSERKPWLEHYQTTGRHQLLVAEANDIVMAYASSSQFRVKAAYDTSVESSVYVAHDCELKGLGSLLYTKLFAALAQEDVHRVYAGITIPNDPSIALHKKFGFKLVGQYGEVGRKFDRYWDVYWYEKSL